MRVLTAIDLSVEGHEWLMARAGGFASRAGARVDAVYVHAPGSRAEDVADQVAQLGGLLLLVPEAVRGEPRSEPGEIAETIVRLAASYDALVVGPREPGAIEAMLKGPMAARVLRRAPVPVLVPRGRAWPARPLRMLVGVDIAGDRRERVLELSADWAAHLGGTLDAVYALGDRPPLIKDKPIRERAHREWLRAREPDRRALADLLSIVPEARRGEALVRPGEADDALVELSGDYDLVIVGNREREGLSRYLLGTVATSVVRQARADVLTLPTRD